MSSVFRCIKNHRPFIGVGGMLVFLFFPLLNSRSSYQSISGVFQDVDGIPFYLSFIFCVYVFGDCFCEDMEYHFHRDILVRQSMVKYIITQVIMVFITAFITMTVGLTLFLCILKPWLPWVAMNDSAANVLIQNSSFREILRGGHYFTFFLLSDIKLGLLAGCLSLVASLVSLFVKNKLLVYSTPVMIFYLIVNWGAKIPQRLKFINLYKVFMPVYNVWDNDILSFLWVIAISILIMVLLGLCIYRRMEVLVKNE